MKNSKNYIYGFIGSFILTMAAYLLVLRHVHSHHAFISDNILLAILTGLAMIQLAVQLLFFLHLGDEPKPKWNLVTFSVMAGVVLILVLGSLWIMFSLNYRHMSPDQTSNYIINDEGFGHSH